MTFPFDFVTDFAAWPRPSYTAIESGCALTFSSNVTLTTAGGLPAGACADCAGLVATTLACANAAVAPKPMTATKTANTTPARIPVRTIRRFIGGGYSRSEEHTSELQSHVNLVCR